MFRTRVTFCVPPPSRRIAVMPPSPRLPRSGGAEAEGLLHRNSGGEDSSRILGAFNEETPDWLSFFMFTYFTDREAS